MSAPIRCTRRVNVASRLALSLALVCALAGLLAPHQVAAGPTTLPTGPWFSFNPTKAPPGGLLDISGGGFDPTHPSATVRLLTANGVSTTLGSVRIFRNGDDGVPAGAVTLPASLEPATYQLTLEDDTSHQLAENVSGPLTVSLDATFSFTPTTVPVGGRITVFGDTFAPQHVSATVGLRDDTGRTTTLGTALVNTYGSFIADFVIPETVLPGRYDVSVRDDATGQLARGLTPSPLTVSASPSFRFTPEHVLLGGTFLIGGSGFSPQSTRVAIALRGAGGQTILLDTAPLVLAPTGYRAFAKSVTLPPSVAPDVYDVLVQDVATRDLAQNQTGQLTVAARTGPDLRVTALSNPPASVVLCPVCPAPEFNVTDTTANEGGQSAPATTTRIFLSLDRRRGSVDVPLGQRSVGALAAGASATATTRVTVPFAVGTFYVLACADDPNHVPEPDEADNCRASASRIQVIYIPD